MEINELNSYYVPPQELFQVFDCFYGPCRGRITPCNSWEGILNKNENLEDALKVKESRISRQDNEIYPHPDVLSARASALMRFIADMATDRAAYIKPNTMEDIMASYWKSWDYIVAASFTPLRSYANGQNQPFFDPIEFMANLDLVRKTMGAVLATFSWGQYPKPGSG